VTVSNDPSSSYQPTASASRNALLAPPIFTCPWAISPRLGRLRTASYSGTNSLGPAETEKIPSGANGVFVIGNERFEKRYARIYKEESTRQTRPTKETTLRFLTAQAALRRQGGTSPVVRFF
jgi:hypothetical protein